MNKWSDNGEYEGIDDDSRAKMHPYLDRRDSINRPMKFVIAGEKRLTDKPERV